MRCKIYVKNYLSTGFSISYICILRLSKQEKEVAHTDNLKFFWLERRYYL